MVLPDVTDCDVHVVIYVTTLPELFTRQILAAVPDAVTATLAFCGTASLRPLVSPLANATDARDAILIAPVRAALDVILLYDGTLALLIEAVVTYIFAPFVLIHARAASMMLSFAYLVTAMIILLSCQPIYQLVF